MKRNNIMNQNSYISKAAVCIVIMLLSTVMLTLIAPLFIMYEYISGEKIWLLVAMIHAISAFAGIWIARIITQERNATILIAGAAIWEGVIFCCGILLFNSKFTYMLPSILGNILGATLAYFLVLHRKKGTMSRRKRKK